MIILEEFHRKLDNLKQETEHMANYAILMLTNAVEAFIKIDVATAKEIHEKRHELRRMDDKIEKEALRLLTLYQPLASDMRKIGSILKIITYLNRIGRYGKDIAKLTFKFENETHFKKLVSIPQMAHIVNSMLNDAIESFKNNSIEKIQATHMEERDDVVDELRYSIFRECVSYMMENPKLITIGSYYIMIARYLERCGDLACRIAEKVHYMVTANFVEIR